MRIENGIEIKVHRINGKVVWTADGFTAKAPISYFQERTISLMAEATPAIAATKTNSEGPTKLERAKAIYDNLADKSRQSVIAAFISQLQMTPAGASTYQNTVKKLK